MATNINQLAERCLWERHFKHSIDMTSFTINEVRKQFYILFFVFFLLSYIDNIKKIKLNERWQKKNYTQKIDTYEFAVLWCDFLWIHFISFLVAILYGKELLIRIWNRLLLLFFWKVNIKTEHIFLYSDNVIRSISKGVEIFPISARKKNINRWWSSYEPNWKWKWK